MSTILELEQKAKEYRRNLVEMTHMSKGVVHLGGSLSAMDIATAVYARYIPNFNDANRSRFVLSKGHVAAMMYAILLGYGVIKKEEKGTLKQLNSRLQGHPDINKIPEVEMNTGLLGQGIGIAMGMAYARKLKKADGKIFALCGDAEMHEGQIWETIQQASHFKLDNLVAIIDYNKLSSHDPVNELINLEPLDKKLEAFNWNVIVINDANDMKQVVEGLDKLDKLSGKPVAIIAHTIKGKGLSFLEGNINNHSVTLTDETYAQALKELA